MDRKTEELLDRMGIAGDILCYGPYGRLLEDEEILRLLEEESSSLKVVLLENGGCYYVGAIIPSDKTIDLNKVKQRLQTDERFSDYRFVPADQETIESVLGCEADKISPFAFYHNGILALVDETLNYRKGDKRRDERRCIAALNGNPFIEFRFHPGELLRLEDYIPCNICETDSPFDKYLDFRY